MTRLRGARVTLRPFRPEESGTLAAAARRAERFARPYDETGDVEKKMHARVASSGSFTDGVISFAIEASGRLAGEVQARQPELGLPPGVFELGIELFEQADRGRGLGGEAVALITTHLFDRLEAHRVQVSTDVDNEPMRQVLERLGFPFEGVLRGFMPAAGGPRDYALYALTRDDWEMKKDGWTRTS